MSALTVQRSDQITPRWLTSALRRTGVLGSSSVAAIQRAPNDAFNSQVAHLRIRYQPLSEPELPSALLVKINQDGNGIIEVEFYQQTMQQPASRLPMLVPCYYAALDATGLQSTVLLRDISDSHTAPVSRTALLAGDGVPDLRVMESIVTVLASFHAWWWERQCCGEAATLTRVRDWFASPHHHDLHFQRRQRELAYFTASTGSDLPTDLRRLLEHALELLPGLWEKYLLVRVREYRQLTLTHGDCYLTNILAPRGDVNGQVYLVDFDSASGNLAAFDLVYLMATFWNRSQRLANGVEQRMLAVYHQALTQFGVQGYSFADLMLDYRLMLSYMLFDPVADLARGSPRSYWWPKLNCLAEAYQDWDCGSL